MAWIGPLASKVSPGGLALPLRLPSADRSSALRSCHEHSLNLPVLAPERARLLGQGVVLDAAETREAPAEACERVLVHYEELSAVFDPVAAMAPGAPRVKVEGNVIAEWNISQGDVAQGFAESSVVVENTYRTTFAEHAYLESEEGVAWLDENGVINIRIGTQTIENFRNVAEVLGLPHSRVRIREALNRATLFAHPDEEEIRGVDIVSFFEPAERPGGAPSQREHLRGGPVRLIPWRNSNERPPGVTMDAGEAGSG